MPEQNLAVCREREGMAITSGTKLGRYQIRSKIGEGGMGMLELR